MLRYYDTPSSILQLYFQIKGQKDHQLAVHFEICCLRMDPALI